MNRSLVWFRRDLRLHDHTALARASASTPPSQGHLLAVYLVSPKEWKEHDEAAIKVDFWQRSLPILRKDLASLRIPLIIRTLDQAKGQHAQTILEVCNKYQISSVHWNREYEMDALSRDEGVSTSLKDHGYQVFQHHDQCIIPPGQVLTKAGTTSKTYSGFLKSWYVTLAHNPVFVKEARFPRANDSSTTKELHEAFNDGEMQESLKDFPLPRDVRDRSRQNFPAGEEAAEERLQKFLQDQVGRYEEDRSSLALQVTSSLSPYLHSGVISARACLRAVKDANGGRVESGMAGAVNWIMEMVWRDFFRHILVAYPKISQGKPFKDEYEHFPWTSDPEERKFRAWAQGQTGYPIVDACMRCLNQTGWLHNRGRMVTASFLCKDLLLDWHKGERYFMQHLIDGDLASNNGNWQWVAASGTDSLPFFRVLNPVRQSKRFDPEGEFIREWVEELRDCPGEEIHQPSSDTSRRLGYPEPMTDHATARAQALRAFQQMRKSAS
ncbi:MAG: deoxyribodipyrimidine photolyase [Piptocephalis tieghemiana]|nr:MAG: deoxyribodipyrimidine photolyase [Piptocephalis tieghemiana]